MVWTGGKFFYSDLNIIACTFNNIKLLLLS